MKTKLDVIKVFKSKLSVIESGVTNFVNDNENITTDNLVYLLFDMDIVDTILDLVKIDGINLSEFIYGTFGENIEEIEDSMLDLFSSKYLLVERKDISTLLLDIKENGL